MSKIEWTEKTWNPIVGCSIVSPGCTNCYAMKMAARLEKMLPLEQRGFNLLPHHYTALTKASNGGPVWTGRVNIAPDRILTEPLRRKKPTTYFVNSMGDLFHESVPDEWIDRVFAVMALSPQHTFQVLTKRSARMRAYLRHKWEDMAKAEDCMWEDVAYWRVAKIAEALDSSAYRSSNVGGCDWWPLPNVWLGVSAEDQKRADERIPDLLMTPAAVRFVSAEPLIGPLDFVKLSPITDAQINALTGKFTSHPGTTQCAYEFLNANLDWVIVGGESGSNARPMHPEWARSIRDQCIAANVPFFFKQWGEWLPIRLDRHGGDDGGRCYWPHDCVDPSDTAKPVKCAVTQPSSFDNGRTSYTLFGRVGKSQAGRQLDGVEWSQSPTVTKASEAA